MTLTNTKSLSLSLLAVACVPVMTAILTGIPAPRVMLSRELQVAPLAAHRTAKNLTQAQIDRCP